MIRKLLFRNFLLVFRSSRWIRRHFTHTGLLLFYSGIAAMVFGINTRQTLSYQIFTLLFSILLISLISILVFRNKFRIKRYLPDYASVGNKFEYGMQVKNFSGKKISNLTVFDELSGISPSFRQFRDTTDIYDKDRNFIDRIIGYPRMLSLIHKHRGGIIEPVEIADIPKNGTACIKIPLMPVRRGYIRFRTTYIGKNDPLGLLRRFRHFDQTDSLLVLPKIYEFPSIQFAGKRTYQHGGVNMASSIGDSQEFFSLRDYRPGDPLRAIHWRSYAKTGNPVVKEYQDEYFARHGLVLDTFQGNKPESVFEEAVSVAASIAVSSRQPDSLLDLMFIKDKAYRFTSGRGLAGVENMLEILAAVDASPDNNIDTLENLLLEHASGTSSFICILLNWDKRRQEMVSKLRSSGTPVIVFVIAKDTSDLPHPDRATLSQAGQFHVLQAGNISGSLKDSGLM